MEAKLVEDVKGTFLSRGKEKGSRGKVELRCEVKCLFRYMHTSKVKK